MPQEQKIRHAVICDFSHCWYIAKHAALNAGPEYDLQEAIVYHIKGKLRTIEKCLKVLGIEGYDLIFAEDRPPLEKIALYPPYRGNRIDNSVERNATRDILIQDGFRGKFFSSEGKEADDVIATLAKRATDNGLLCCVVTGDRDLWQLISPTISVFDPIKKEIVSPQKVLDAFAVGPIHLPLVKSLWGDAGDCVPNAVPRMKKHLLPLVRQTANGTFEEWKSVLAGNWLELSPKCCSVYSEGQKQVETNYTLVKLVDDCSLEWV